MLNLTALGREKGGKELGKRNIKNKYK